MAKKIKGVTCITRNGSTYWYARVNGQRVYCGKGDKGYDVAVAARSKYVAKRYENREMAAGLKVRKAEFRTVQDMSNWYMTLPTIQQQKSYQRKVNSAAHLLKYFGKMRVNQVEADDMERYRECRKVQGAADGTVNLEIALLRAMYHLARKRKKLHADALPGEFVTNGEVNPRRMIAEEEFYKLLKHVDGDFGDVLICGYESAMRSSEIADLQASQVHLNVRHFSGDVLDYIDLGIFDTKTGARRTVPVSERLKEVLERRLQGLEPEDYVFSDKVGKYNNKRISRKMELACKRAGIPHGDKLLNEKGERIGVVFHCLRHTRTTRWVEAGFSDEIIRRATGHKSLEAYRNYVKITDAKSIMRLVREKKRHTNDIKSPQIPALSVSET